VRAWFNPLNEIAGKDSGTSVARSYEWDEENRLHAIVEGTNRTVFFYNALGHCGAIEEFSGTNLTLTRLFTWTGDQLCEERNVAGSSTYYKWYYEQGCWSFYDFLPVYFTKDHLGSVRELTRNYDGAVWRRYAYEPFGRQTNTDYLSFLSQPHPGPELGLSGLFTLKPQNLLMAEYRVYDPDFGRWLSRDPVGEAGGLNLYRYANNDPVNFVDLDGLCPVPGTPMNNLGKSGGSRPPRPPRVLNSAGPSGQSGNWGPQPSNGGNGSGPYRSVGGHHVHAKKGFEGAPGYNAGDAFSISDSLLEQYGVRHPAIGPIQQRLFRELARSSLPNNLAQHSRVAYKALVEAGIPSTVAKEWVIASQRQLIQSGVFAPTRIPWVTR
jgi:RHS repeat-associated protein